ncbi:hypothetical protein BSG1_12531 [Bacillus sp. SG-1]|nr:hypothetical protein BSG1_12531 [Bacillus sp. SG-1]
MSKNKGFYIIALLIIGGFALILTSYIKDQPFRDIAWQYVEENNWEQEGVGKWASTVTPTIAGNDYSHHLYDPSFGGMEIYKVESFGGDGANGVPAILISKETNEVVGIIPTE